MPLFD